MGRGVGAAGVAALRTSVASTKPPSSTHLITCSRFSAFSSMADAAIQIAFGNWPGSSRGADGGDAVAVAPSGEGASSKLG